MVERDDSSAEDRLIARFFKPLATHPGALGLSDDAALLTPPPGCDLVLTTDAIVGGVHFFADDAPRHVARKALRVNLSDLAAKGARPLGFLLSLALPKEADEQLARCICARPARRCGPVRLSAVRRRHRSHAGPDDRLHRHVRQRAERHHGAPRRRQSRRRVFVTGTIGDAALGVMARARAPTGNLTDAQRAASDFALSAAAAAQRAGRGRAQRMPRRRWMSPTGWPAISPSCAASPALRPRSTLRACRCRMRPRRSSRAEPSALETVLTGGDDYEIICTVPPAEGRKLPRRGKGRQRAGHRDRRDRGRRGRSLSRRRRSSRSPSSAPLSVISEIGRTSAPDAGYNTTHGSGIRDARHDGKEGGG